MHPHRTRAGDRRGAPAARGGVARTGGPGRQGIAGRQESKSQRTPAAQAREYGPLVTEESPGGWDSQPRFSESSRSPAWAYWNGLANVVPPLPKPTGLSVTRRKFLLPNMVTAVGRSVPRRDGASKVTGEARYTDDLVIPGAWYGKTIRSTIPRGT